MAEIAIELGKAANTISMIVNTDLFKDYLARRKDAWRKEHDFAILSRVTRVAELSMDSAIEHLEKKKDQVPLAVAVEAMNSALDRLGYGPKTGPQVAVQVNTDNSTTQTVVVQGVSASALEEARAALRIAESKRAEEFDGRLARHPAPTLIEDTVITSKPDSGSEVDGSQGVLDLDLTLPKE